MPKVKLIYGLFFSEMAGQYEGTLEFHGHTLADLISALDRAYGEFSDELIDPETGGLRTRNQIFLQRQGQKTRPFFSLDAEVHDDDTITFY